MKCQDFVELITNNLEGDDTLEERVRFRWHRLICAPCRRYYLQMQITQDLLRHLPEPPICARSLQTLQSHLGGPHDVNPFEDHDASDP